MLLPMRNTALRRSIDQWFDSEDIQPKVVGEFEDSALMKVFGAASVGLFAAPSAIKEEIGRQYRVRSLGELPEVREQYYAISAERKLKHPAVVAISEAARQELFV